MAKGIKLLQHTSHVGQDKLYNKEEQISETTDSEITYHATLTQKHNEWRMSSNMSLMNTSIITS